MKHHKKCLKIYWVAVSIRYYECLCLVRQFIFDSIPIRLTLDIEWPQDDEALSNEAVEAVENLLTMDPAMRPLSTDVKQMAFFQSIDWDNLQVMEPPFLPQPENAHDTGYFEGKTTGENKFPPNRTFWTNF